MYTATGHVISVRMYMRVCTCVHVNVYKIAASQTYRSQRDAEWHHSVFCSAPIAFNIHVHHRDIDTAQFATHSLTLHSLPRLAHWQVPHSFYTATAPLDPLCSAPIASKRHLKWHSHAVLPEPYVHSATLNGTSSMKAMSYSSSVSGYNCTHTHTHTHTHTTALLTLSMQAYLTHTHMRSV